MSFRRNLKNIRKNKKINQRDLAELTGLSYSMISKLESGEQSNPTLETINKIAEALEVNPAKLTYKLANEVKQYEQFDQYFNSDIGKMLEFLLEQLGSENYALLFDGDDLDDDTRELLKSSLENTYNMAKIISNKKKRS